jgi:hypothetical protein
LEENEETDEGKKDTQKAQPKGDETTADGNVQTSPKP